MDEESVDRERLINWVREARQRTMDLISDLSDEQLLGPQLDVINPLLWEVGHIAWFQEKWVLRQVLGQKPVRPNVDPLYDSISIPHDVRWDLPLPLRDQTLAYARRVRDRVIEALQEAPLTKQLAYHVQYSVFHEDMHAEAFTYTRQTLGYPPPIFCDAAADSNQGRGGDPADALVDRDEMVEIPQTEFLLGASHDGSFVFDNEKWAHPVRIRAFAMARTPVTETQFAAFVDEQGYERREFWSESGWKWRESAGAGQPLYWWRETPGRWLRRDFETWKPLDSQRPMMHVNWFEAEAWCRWAKRRLPTEAEWELAASAEATGSSLDHRKRRFPWGDEPPTPRVANLDWKALGPVGVHQLAPGDSVFGCRQMIGNVWEWTSSDFQPYPGFTSDSYREYSQPWFGTRKVLRGGCWATRSRLIRNTWRNFYTPERRDVWSGFRTCALGD